MLWYFGHEACGILALQPGIEPVLPALEDEVLTTGPPEKSWKYGFLTTGLPEKSQEHVFRF